MKGINVKKLAAIVTGAALLGSAVAPIVTAAAIQKGDLYNDDGTPKVNIVVGSKAALSDAVWAGNLAAKIAEKAAVQKTVEVTAGTGGTGGSATGTIDLNGLTVDVTIGGTVSYGASSKEFKLPLSSTAGSAGLELGNTPDANLLTSAQLPHLFNSSKTEKVTNGDQTNQSTTQTITEKIGVSVDAKFAASESDIKDLVGYIESGGLFYEVTLGSSGIDLGSTSFTDGSDDSVKVVFFGEEYELNTATLSGSKNLKLIKSSAKETLNEGIEIEGLVGDNKYKDQAVKVKFKQLSATSATATYQATFELYDSEGNLIDTKTISQGTNLRDEFKDSSGNEALKSNLFVETVANASTTNLGFVEVTKGTDTLLLYDGKGYPYDSTDTLGVYDYSVTLTANDTNNLHKIKVSNSRDKWNNTRPLYPTKAGQSLTGKTGTQAVFGNSLPEGTLGKGFVKVEFAGFEEKEEITTVEFGTGVTGLDTRAKGGVSFRGYDDTQHSVPFALELDDSETGDTFTFDTKTIWFDMNYGATTASGTNTDLNFSIVSGDYVNGRAWTIAEDGTTASDQNITITVAGIGALVNVHGGVGDLNWAIGESFNIDGVTYTVMDNNSVTGTLTPIFGVDGKIRFKKNNSAGDLFYNTSLGTGNDATDQTYGNLYFTVDKIFDANSATANVGFGGAGDKKVYYAVNPGQALNRLWLMLDADTLGADEASLIQNSKIVDFLGTTYPNDASQTELKGIGYDFQNTRGVAKDLNSTVTTYSKDSGTSRWVGHYVPKDTDFNSNTIFSNSNAYTVAQFVVDDAVSAGDLNVYLDTQTGGALGPFSNTNLSGYSTDVDYNAASPLNWSITSGSQSNYLSAGYTDAGTKVMLAGNDAGVKVLMTDKAQNVVFFVHGKDVTKTVTGDTLAGLKVNDTATTASGTKVTVTAVKGGSCKVSTVKGEPGACTADPETFTTQAPVANPIVWVDTDNPVGTNVVVGGHIVNKLASGLADRLTTAGQKIVEVDAATDTIYVAGYTAQDTIAAVKELIDAIDSFA